MEPEAFAFTPHLLQECGRGGSTWNEIDDGRARAAELGAGRIIVCGEDVQGVLAAGRVVEGEMLIGGVRAPRRRLRR